ncbi:MAG TPA: hypothetical protein PLW44_15700 [Chitinophagales bacterium]|nr:hypothetical protein [Chitinophagales bacterium]
MKISGKEVSVLKLITVIGTVVGAILSSIQLYEFACNKFSLSEAEVKQKATAALLEYQTAINTQNFDAYKLFDSRVERFITMKNVTPAEINEYINNSYYAEFINPTITFDMNSITVNRFDKNGVEIEVIQNDDFYRYSKKRKERHKTHLKIILNKDYKIKLFDLYRIIK